MANVEANRPWEERTLKFAVAIVRFVATFPPSATGIVVGRQLLKAGTSVGANYREANRAESRDDLQHKTAVVLKKAAETDYRLELCVRVELGDPSQRAWLCEAGRELPAIFTTINRRAKGK